MKHLKFFAVLLLLGLLTAYCATGKNGSDQAKLPTMTGFADEGTFRLYESEEPTLTNTFIWKADGSYQSGTTFIMANQSTYSSLTIYVNAAGQWTGIHKKDPGRGLAIYRDGNTAQIGRDTKVQLKPGTILDVRRNPAFLSMVVRAYDQTKGGRQTIPSFFIPEAEVVNIGITRLTPVERKIKGLILKLTPYLIEDRDGERTIHADENGRIVLYEIPWAYFTYVREGYEELVQFKETGKNISAPQHEVVMEKNVMIPMRDGVSLATDIYRPQAEGKWPVILTRTPYMKDMNELWARFYARRGYIYAVQDCRGQFSSQGSWEPFVNEARDGYDTIEWLAGQPWSSGKVGMIGLSYAGMTQWWAARERPPHLTTIIPNCSAPDPYVLTSYDDGCFRMAPMLRWSELLQSQAFGDLSGQLMRNMYNKNWYRLKDLPVIDLDQIILKREIGYYRTWLAHPDLDSYWASVGFLDHLAEVKIPVFHQSGWFDHVGKGTKLNYLKMRSYGHANQKLVIGPWGHTEWASRNFEGYDFGKKAFVDLHRDYLRWFDFWLKGMDNGILREPLVSLFVMGSNEWIHGDTYPLPQTQMTKLYLSSKGKARGSKGDGLLIFEQSKINTPADHFIYDPGDPTPPTPLYQGKADDMRSDMLVYQTPPLKAPLTFAGPISAKLFASSSAKDTDWFMRLMVVDPQGRIYNLVQGKIRARYRNSFEKPELLKPGEIYPFNLDLWHTAVQVPVNGRLRVEIASASFPEFSRNLNTGGHNETETEYVKAEQTVYHDAAHPSHILLPLVNPVK